MGRAREAHQLNEAGILRTLEALQVLRLNVAYRSAQREVYHFSQQARAKAVPFVPVPNTAINVPSVANRRG